MNTITPEFIDAAFRGFHVLFQDAFQGVASHRDKLAMTVKSNTTEELYGWLGQFPGLREWIGDRVIKSLSANGYRINNRKFESTVSIKRDEFEDDSYGIYAPMFSEMGRVAANHPDTLVMELLRLGFDLAGYDGAPFFSDLHPVSGDPADVLNVAEPKQSNFQAGDGPGWYLIDAGRAIKPIIWQERTAPEFTSLTDPKSYPVFMRDDFLFGIRARNNAGYGLWQLAFGSKAPLTPENYELARLTMQGLVGNELQLLGVQPTHLIVPPALETRARQLINADVIDGTSNIWKGSAELVQTPYLV